MIAEKPSSSELSGYLEVGGAHLYTVLHQVSNPVARVLLCGPFAPERNYSYIAWVKWARFLSQRRIEVLRYDYRGIGESTGTFDDMSFAQWSDDVQAAAAWLKARSPNVPLVLHGLELGGILAKKNFLNGIGSALLMWSPPPNTNEVLRALFLRRMAIAQTFKGAAERLTLTDYVQQLEVRPVEVEGYRLTAKLWRDSLAFDAGIRDAEARRPVSEDPRPVRLLSLDSRSAPLVKGSALGYLAINPDLTTLFTENLQWLTSLSAN